MDRMLALSAQVAIALGHRVEVTEQVDPFTDEPLVLGVVDLDTGIRYQFADERSEPSRWIGRVLGCTVTNVGGGSRTTLLVDPIEPGAAGARVALRDADAAADAAKAQADRWGGSDRPPPEEPERFW